MEISSKSNNVVPINSAPKDVLTELLREGARKMLELAIDEEVAAYIESHKHLKDDQGHRQVVRNGHHPQRSIQTGIGNIDVRQPRVNDTRIDDNGERIQFKSSILPPYLRRSKSIEELIPWLYLKGISTGDFSDALVSLLGVNAKGLSATTVTRLKSHWLGEHEEWSKRSLVGKHFVYFWADGIYPRVRLEDSEGQCFLVIMGATLDGKKELVAISEGSRESEIAWTEILLDLKRRGLAREPALAVGDGSLGFWAALNKVFPKTKQQRCWVHKTCNVLDKFPKNKRPKAKELLHDIWMADTRSEAEAAMKHFEEVYSQKYERAVACLLKDRESLLSFYDFPAEHWKHLRTTNPIESTFATIRLRTKRTKGHGTVKAALAMAFQLAKCAEKKWKKLRGSQLLADVIDLKIVFKDGIKVMAA
jgi:transposase-like protein